MDTYDKYYKTPEDVGVSSSRPDSDAFLDTLNILH